MNKERRKTMDTKFAEIEAIYKTTGYLTDGQISWLSGLAKGSSGKLALKSKMLLEYYGKTKNETEEEVLAHIKEIAKKEGGRLAAYDEFYLCRIMLGGEDECIRIEARDALATRIVPYVKSLAGKILTKDNRASLMGGEGLEAEAYLKILKAAGSYRPGPENPARSSTYVMRFLHKEVGRIFYRDSIAPVSTYGLRSFAKLAAALESLGYKAIPADGQADGWEALCCSRREIEDMVSAIRGKALAVLAESKSNTYLTEMGLEKSKAKKARQGKPANEGLPKRRR
jgi:hypothetical protein